MRGGRIPVLVSPLAVSLWWPAIMCGVSCLVPCTLVLRAAWFGSHPCLIADCSLVVSWPRVPPGLLVALAASPGFSRPRGLSGPWICGTWASDRQPLRRTRRITVESRSLSARQGVSTPTLTPTFAGRHRLKDSQRVDILPLTDDCANGTAPATLR